MLLCDSKKIADITSGFCNTQVFCKGVYSDTRENGKDKLFVALKGEYFDGHNFIKNAEENGAAAVLVNKKTQTKLAQIIVKDTAKAYREIALWHRQLFSPKVIAITGSNGKTSVKNMLTSILSIDANTLSTKGNLNNNLGVPKTLLNLNKSHKYCVVEMGANHVNEISLLCAMAKPDLAIITNINNAHIGGFGCIENIVKTKGEIFTSLTNKGIAFFNARSIHKKILQDMAGKRELILFGENSNIFASNIKENENSLEFILNCNTKHINIKLNMIGTHQIENALAVSACATKLGIKIDVIKQGLETAVLEKNRLSVIKYKNFTILDDSYNANPHSMKAAIKTLSKRDGEKVAVLGSMAELGDYSAKLHLEIANYIKNYAIKNVYTIGKEAKNYNGKHFTDIKSLYKHLCNKHIDATILIKGSRIMQLNKLVDFLKN